METIKSRSKHRRIIILLSIVIPVVVALLFSYKIPNSEPLTFLPPIYASINAITSLLLILAFVAIKKQKIKLHQRLMQTCLALSALFLIGYLAYHMTSDPTSFGGTGTIKYVYYLVLISHILLSIIIIPLVLITYSRAITGRFPAHKKLAKITFPLWLYVAVSGVMVYLLIAPYYAN